MTLYTMDDVRTLAKKHGAIVRKSGASLRVTLSDIHESVAFRYTLQERGATFTQNIVRGCLVYTITTPGAL